MGLKQPAADPIRVEPIRVPEPSRAPAPEPEPTPEPVRAPERERELQPA